MLLFSTVQLAHFKELAKFSENPALIIPTLVAKDGERASPTRYELIENLCCAGLVRDRDHLHLLAKTICQYKYVPVASWCARQWTDIVGGQYVQWSPCLNRAHRGSGFLARWFVCSADVT